MSATTTTKDTNCDGLAVGGTDLNALLHNVNTSLIYTPYTVTALSSLSSDYRANRHAPITTQTQASQKKNAPQHGVRGLRNLLKSEGAASPLLGDSTSSTDDALTVLSGHTKGHLLAWKADTMSVVGTFTQEDLPAQQQRASDSASNRSGTPSPTTPTERSISPTTTTTTVASASGKLLSNFSAINAIVVTDTKIITVSGRYDEDEATTTSSSPSDANNMQALHVWCKKTMRHLHTLEGHEDRITCIAVNPMDENNLISGSADKMILEWNLPCCTPVAAYLGHEQGGVLQLSYLSPTSANPNPSLPSQKKEITATSAPSVLRKHIFLSSGADGTMRLWKSAGHPPTPTPTSPLSSDDVEDRGYTTATMLDARTASQSEIKAMRREQRRNNTNISRFAGAPLSRSGSTLGNYNNSSSNTTSNATSPNRDGAGSRLGTPSGYLQVPSNPSSHPNKHLLTGFTLRQQLTLKNIPVLVCVEVLPDIHGGQNITYLEVTAAEITAPKNDTDSDHSSVSSKGPLSLLSPAKKNTPTAKVAVITASSGGTVAIHEFHFSQDQSAGSTTWSTANNNTTNTTWSLIANGDGAGVESSIYSTLTFNQKVHRALTTDICWDKGLVFAASACDGLTIVHTPTKISLKLTAHTISNNYNNGSSAALSDATKMKNLFAGTGIRHLGIDTTRKLLLCGCDNGSIKVLSYATFYRETADLCSPTTTTTTNTDNTSAASTAAVISTVDRNPEKMVTLVTDTSPHRGAVTSILLQQRPGIEEGTFEWERIITSGADRSLYIMDFNTLRDARVAAYQAGDLTLSQTTTLASHHSKTTVPIVGSASFLQAVDHGGFLWSLPEMVRQKGPGKILESTPRATAAQLDHGHRSQITTVQQFPKINKLLSGSSAGELRFWGLTERPASSGATFITTTTTTTTGKAVPPTSPPPEHQSPKRSNVVARNNTTVTATSNPPQSPSSDDQCCMFIDWAAAAADSASSGAPDSDTTVVSNIMIQPHPTSNLLFEMYSVIDVSEPIIMTAASSGGSGQNSTLAVVTLQTTHGPGSFTSGAIMVVNVDTEAVVSPLLKIGDSGNSGVPVRTVVVHDRNSHTTAPFFVIVQRRNGESALHQISVHKPEVDSNVEKKASPTPAKSSVPTFTISPVLKIIASPQIAALTPPHHHFVEGVYDGPNSLQHPHPIYTTVSGCSSSAGTFSVLQMNHNALELCTHRQEPSDHQHSGYEPTTVLPPTFKSSSVFTIPFLESTSAVLAQRALKYWRSSNNNNAGATPTPSDAPEHKLYLRSVSCYTVIGGPTAFIAAVALDNGIVTLIGSEIAASTPEKDGGDLQMFNQQHRKFDIHFDGTVTEPGIRYFVLPAIDVTTNKTTARIREQQESLNNKVPTTSGGGSVCTCLTASLEARILALGYSCGTALLWDMSNHTITRRIHTQISIRTTIPSFSQNVGSSSRRTSLDAATTPRITKGLTNSDGGEDDSEREASAVPVSHIIVFGTQKRVVTCTAAALRIDTLLPRAILPN